jgi:carbamoyltransferase
MVGVSGVIRAGAALYAYHSLMVRAPRRVAGKDIEALATGWQLPVRRHNQVARAAAAAIARGEIVGWFQDGPNCLGSRSILCHPGIEGTKNQLDARMKSGAPSTGSVLAEQARQWFAIPAKGSPFMAHSGELLAHRRAMVSELDGACRVNTVAGPGLFRRLIESFEDQTGLPMVVTTAFNPMVEYPEDALDFLSGAVIDRLFIGDLEFQTPEIPHQVTDPARCGTRHPPRAPHLAVPS